MSLDQFKYVVQKTVKLNGWENYVEHWIADLSDCKEQYSVESIPHMLIINKDGTIAFKGHPHVRLNLENDIDSLLADQPLEGITPGILNQEQAPHDFVEMNKGQIDKEIDQIS